MYKFFDGHFFIFVGCIYRSRIDGICGNFMSNFEELTTFSIVTTAVMFPRAMYRGPVYPHSGQYVFYNFL